tara:strand:+ start:2900 stop:3904 length:1005 start_codon:yes stop_codon:yes gene_type:complete
MEYKKIIKKYEKKNILIRVDSGNIIGIGHIKRCLNLAKYLKSINCNIFFCTKKHNGFLTDDNYFFYKLDVDYNIDYDYNTWLGSDINKEVDIISKICKEQNIDLIIIDHYNINYKWENLILQKNVNIKLFVIDDLFRKHNCHYFLSQYYSKNPRFDLNLDCIKLIGPKYCIFDEDLIDPKFKRTDYKIKNILISFGGSDSLNLTEQIIDNLLQNYNEFIKYEYFVILGPCYKYTNKLIKKTKTYKNIKIYFNIDAIKMKSILKLTQLCIGTLGMSTYERLYYDIRNIIITIAENQIQSAKDLHEDKQILYLGYYKNIYIKNINIYILIWKIKTY